MIWPDNASISRLVRRMRQHTCIACYTIARPSVRLSVTRMDQSKTVEDSIMQL